MMTANFLFLIGASLVVFVLWVLSDDDEELMR